jgi:DNA-binding MarR family transcriptional regulator
MLDLFRLSSRLLTVGDRLAAGLGLTSARWQILGAITSAERPQPVAWLARDLGGNRQNVQRIVTTCTKRVSSHSRSIRITGELNSSR